ncbi:MAG TPA: BMP family ABC transporter substrate-binding protein [Chloroflexota bacterium]|nr:BMP family ABC transporter substrate-binding protein [Chloroflexota bacterium]
MKKLTILGAFALIFSLVSGYVTPSHAATTSRSSVSVLLYIDGSLGDLGFFDSANSGVTRAKSQLGVSLKVVQQSDATQWQTQLLALAGSGRYSVIVLDSSDATMNIATKALLTKYPKQKVIDFDDNAFATNPSVSSIIYKQNEGSFLAGALAAMVADSNLPFVSHKRAIGMVGGQKIPVIIDFQDGYVQGAKAVDSSISVAVTFIGGSGGNDTWNNKPAGARLAASLFSGGSAVVYQVAGGSGLGVLSQAKLANRYAIGVDSNQDSVAPGHVIGSVVKRVDNSVFDLIKFATQGKLQGAHIYYYGLQNHGVDLTRDSYTRAIITPAMYKKLDALEAQVMSGKIKVKTAF